MKTTESEARRLNLADTLRRESIEFDDAAGRFGISTNEAQQLWEKNCEVENARKFLSEFGLPIQRLLTLKEFNGVDTDNRTGIDLDYVCPDVVAVMSEGNIDLELTAYADNQTHDRLSAVMWRVHELARSEIASEYPDLSGFTIFYSPSKSNPLRGRDARRFVEQLLDFVLTKHTVHPFLRDEDRHFPEYGARPPRRPFENWGLLEQHVSSVTICFREPSVNLPASVPPGGFAASFRTKVEHLSAKICAKEVARQKAYTTGLHDLWLLIHATGGLPSSRVTPMDPWEITRLLSSPAAENARKTGFGRVLIWDGLHGGYVDLVTGESRARPSGTP